jgi:dCTP deaminase
MVLSDVEVKAEIAAKRLVFDPPIPDDPSSGRFGSSSIDLLLHEELIILPKDPIVGVKALPGAEGDVMDLLRKYGQTNTLQPGKPQTIDPHVRAVGKTLEHVTLPPHIAGRIEGRSSLARYGLAVHISAPTVMAGFRGRLYLEMYNYGPFSMELEVGMNIAQLVLEHVGLLPTRGYQGRYSDQT